MRDLHLLERVAETLRAALDDLTTVVPDWLRGIVPPTWFERDGRRIKEHRLPKGQEKRDALALEIGADGFFLLDAIAKRSPGGMSAKLTGDEPGVPAAAHEVTMPQTLRDVWRVHHARNDGPLRWRNAAELPPVAERMQSPDDPQAHFSMKRQLGWTGHKVHTIRTQLTICLRRALASRRRAAQRDNMADLQVVLMDDDALDDELQDCLLFGERSFVQPPAHAFAERGQVEQELLGLGALAA